MSFILPPTIAISSSHFWPTSPRYLNYSDDTDSGQTTNGHLRINGENVFSRLANFEVVTANTGTGGLVHIRCLHNRKFLRRRTEKLVNLTPEADEPEEDQSKWSCTLFEPQLAEDGNPAKARLFHVQSKLYARAWLDSTTIPVCKLAEADASASVFNITDLESLVILPKHVAFKVHTSNYLMLVEGAKLRFRSTDKAIPESWFEVSTDGHGRVQIKSYHDNSYWFNSSDRIWSDPSVAATNPSTLFWPVKVNGNTVALKSNDKYCAHTNDENGTDGLSVAYTSITANSRFTLEELVLSRRIYNTDFDLKNAIIYGETPIVVATANATNNTSVTNTVEFRFEHTESQSNTWTSSHSWMVGISVQISAKIPFGLGGIENTYSAEYNGSYEWGETITTESALETKYTATVPANTSISVRLMATKGNCDVPYSYYQRDVLYNGKTVIYKKDDGLYTGVNSYNFRYEVSTLTEPEISKSTSSTIEQKLPIPLVDPSTQQKIPMPLPFGSTTKQTLVTTTSTTTSEQELALLQIQDAVAPP